MDRLNWNDVNVFLALYRGRSVRAAATELGMSHSTVSRHLTELETCLNAVLFTRSREGLLATKMAQQVFEQAEKVESEVLGFQRVAANLDTVLSGEVRITAPPLLSHVMLVPIIAAFTRRYPGIEIVLKSTYAFEDLMKGEADVAFRAQYNPNDSLVGRRLPDFGERAYASQDYLNDHWFEGDQTNATWIGRGTSDSAMAWFKNSPFPNATVRHQMTDLQDQAQAALSGLGMASLPCFFGDQINGLVRVPNTKPLASRPVWVLTHPDLRTSERVRTFIRFLVAELNKQKQLITGVQDKA
ncbi:LysR family transcriptional regulator [Cognatishimia sp.]|uniref:LysR family transcriptional regulator n=1 Tax=Cognatishimia sp. TaxID=2211648 RepID=UPI0035151A85